MARPLPQGGTWKKDKVVNLLDSEDTVDLLDEDGLGPAAIEEYEPEQPTATGGSSYLALNCLAVG